MLYAVLTTHKATYVHRCFVARFNALNYVYSQLFRR